MKKQPPAPLTYDQQARVLSLARVYWGLWRGGANASVRDGGMGALNGLIDTMNILGWRVRDYSDDAREPYFEIERRED